MPATYEAIATQNVSGVSSVSFTSIPATYTDLKIVFVGYDDAPLIKMNFNGTSTGNVTLYMSNSSVGTSAGYGTPYIYVLTPNANAYFMFTVNVMNYTSTNTWKPWVSHCGISHGAGGISVGGGNWQSTAAINRVDFSTTSLTMSGTFTIYGIKAA
jgi:hypothetical protein